MKGAITAVCYRPRDKEGSVHAGLSSDWHQCLSNHKASLRNIRCQKQRQNQTTNRPVKVSQTVKCTPLIRQPSPLLILFLRASTSCQVAAHWKSSWKLIAVSKYVLPSESIRFYWRVYIYIFMLTSFVDPRWTGLVAISKTMMPR